MRSDRALTFPAEDGTARDAGFIDRFACRAVRARIASLSSGMIALVEGDRTDVLGAPAAGGDFGDDPLRCTVTVNNPSAWAALALRGSPGAGESYAAGAWDCSDLTRLIRMVLRDENLMRSLDSGLPGLVASALGWANSRRRNTRAGSRQNIAAHYDIGNAAFALILDETLTYSCGLFETETATLAEASVAKLERLCRKLRLGPSDHLLEIGTGWGSMAIHAAARHGCRVTTTTISSEQHALATERVARAGLGDRVTVLLEDYRDLRGTFDKLVSIEMIEAVGHEFLPAYFRACCERLAPSGLMALQAITIADHAYEQHRRSVDLIKRHVFPGSNIPSLAAMTAACAEATDFRVLHLEDIGPHYARTLAEWRRRLGENRDELVRLGWSNASIRGWEFYFAYCEAGFAERYLGNLQVVLARPRHRGESLLGSLA